MDYSPFDPAAQHQSASRKIVIALERIAEAFRVLLWNEGKALGLSPIQIQTLIFLLFHEPEKRKVSFLAGEFNMTKATISDAVKALEQKGLIEKEYEPHDTRSYVIHLTERGRELAQQTSLFAGELLAPIEKMAESEQENLLLGLLEIIRHLNSAGVITPQRMCYTCAHYASDPPYCRLLNQALAPADVRVDCPEHQL
jgi:DNA-binding MarR family transcriptional regulator